MRKPRIISLTFALTFAIFAGVTGITLAVGSPRPAAAAGSEVWYGFYTDAPSYAPGDTINIYASSPNQNTVFRLVRLDTGWNEYACTEIINVGPQVSKVGSFIEFPGLTLAGRSDFTLEGWFHPPLLGGDATVIAGQFGESQAAAAIMVLSDTGRIAAYVSNVTATITDPLQYAIAPAPANFNDWLDSWHHLAMTYNGSKVKLYIDGVLAAQRNQTGTVAPLLTSTVPFPLGARAEAPGDMTGVIDGRIDSWAVWPAALDATQVISRYNRGLTEGNPAPQNLNNVDLYVAFEDTCPAVTDSSHNNYASVVVNHGNPGVAGILTDTGKAFRLNHDQIVDAGWSLTAQLTIPPNIDSGMYAVQALTSPYTPTTVGDRLTARAIAIRPAITPTRAPIAVVLPTNTWNSYNHWPETAPAGNMLTWRMVKGTNQTLEVRKFGKAPILGIPDLQSGIDGLVMGRLRDAALCNDNTQYDSGYKYKALGVRSDGWLSPDKMRRKSLRRISNLSSIITVACHCKAYFAEAISNLNAIVAQKPEILSLRSE